MEGGAMRAVLSTTIPALAACATILRSEYDPADNHQMGLFNRSAGAQAFPGVISAIADAAK
ncbi:MAG: hypothetical protein K0R43_166 [Pseudoduganella sp.]|jgi:hypothetical protein|nr:hypothetical protein [Pseudoduganella sp.]